jgi:CBS domain-containing protein
MVKNVVSVSSEDSVSTAFNKMKKGMNQLPVVNGSAYVGMLSLKHIAVKSLDPKQAKCGNFVMSVPTLGSDDDLETAAGTIMNSGFRALPVVDNELVGILSETDLLSLVDKSYFKVPISSIATDCEFVSKGDTVGKARKLMATKNISRLPVVEKEAVIGVIGPTDLVRLLEGKESMPARGGKTKEPGAKEKVNLEDSLVENFMHKPAIVKTAATLRDAINFLRTNEELIITEGGLRIVTPKDVLEFVIGSKEDTLHTDVIGMQDESVAFKAKLDKVVVDFKSKMEKIVERAQYLFVHVEKSHKSGNKPLYLIRARFGTPKGMFVAKAQGWDPITAAQDVSDKLETEVIKKYGRTRDTKMKNKILTKRRERG